MVIDRGHAFPDHGPRRGAIERKEGTMPRVRDLGLVGAGALLLAIGPHMPEITLPGIWFAVTFLLHGWRGMPTRSGLPWLALALYAGLSISNRGSIPVAGPLYFVIVALVTALALVPLVLDRWIGVRIVGWASTLVFPMAFVARELLESRLPHGPGTWGSLAYTQYGNLALMQLAAVTGIWGLTFMITWGASVVSWAWQRGFAWNTVRPLVATYAGLLGVITVGGALRLSLSSPSTTIRAATVSFPSDLFTPREMFRIADGRIPVEGAVAEKIARLHEWFFENTEREARAGARLVAWPEMNFLVPAADEPAALERAQRLAAKEHIYLAMGIGAVQPGAAKPFQNKTVLVDPSGRIAYSYLKSRPVSGWEEGVMQPGDGRLPVIATELGRLATAICFDGDHPDLVRQVGQGHADLFILPVNDWPAIKRSHFAMAAFRAIENGMPVLRPTSFGVSGAFDSLGRVLAETDHFSGALVMVAQVPMGSVPTLYPRVGDLFAWLCVAGCALAPILARRGTGHGALGREPVAELHEEDVVGLRAPELAPVRPE
jgi:apolipoprotein N-acyltransferase